MLLSSGCAVSAREVHSVTPSPQWNHLEVGYKFAYDRLGDGIILNVLDEEYSRESRAAYR